MRTFESSLADLQLICNSSMDKLKHIENHQPLSELVQLVDNRNKDNTIKNLLGINVDKVFMPSKANVGETDLSKYKIVQKEQFAYSAMQVGRDETVRVVLYSFDDPAIISPAYLVFEVIDKLIVLPEFLMLWFYRPEFNRFGWFISDSSVRASLEWERFKEIKIPIPDINVQEAIVSIYHTLETRKRINEQLKKTIKPLCPVLMKGVVECMVLEKVEKLSNNFTFITFPYDAENEIHGFEIDEMTKITGERVNKVCRGGFFGGYKNVIKKMNGSYYDLMKSTLDRGLMGTEESLFSILMYTNASIVDYVEIDYNGLIYKFLICIHYQQQHQLTQLQ
jgi:hypothetical protein